MGTDKLKGSTRINSVARQKERSLSETDYSKYDFSHDKKDYDLVMDKGLNEGVVREISRLKGEPEWMLDFRLRALKAFFEKPMPTWGADLSGINFQDIIYYLRASKDSKTNWEDVPDYVKKTFDRLGIPDAEKKFLAGVGAQYDSEVVYHSIRKDLEKLGVVFLSMDDGLKQYPELVKEHFSKVIPLNDNKFAALNSAVWSGGCLTKDSQVFTSNPGIKSIGDIKAGDKVFALSEDGNVREAVVLAQINSGKKPVYEFRVAGRTLKATKNHMFLALVKSDERLDAKGKRWYKTWKKLGDLKNGDIIAITKKLPDMGKSYVLPELKKYIKNRHLERNKVPPETTEDLMWLLGVLVGDGTIYKVNPNMCQINFALPKTDLARKKAIAVVKKIFGYVVTTSNTFSFTVYSKALGDWLLDIGFTGKAKTKTIPKWVFGLPRGQRLAFLGGLLDSDGYIDTNAGAVMRIELANKPLIEQIKLLAISCGLFSDGKVLSRTRKAVFFKKEQRKIYSGTSHSCRISGNVKEIKSRNSRIIKKLNKHKGTHDKYTTITGENFSSEASEWVGFAPIKEKKYVGIEEVYDIQVEKYANFISNGIIAHNSFVYIPKGVKVDIPLQAYFRINGEQVGQFERTLIIVDEGAQAHYVEGCSAPKFSTQSLHSAVVEVIAKKGSHVRYTTIQNWSNNIYNLVTKRAFAYENATVEWVDGNLGCLAQGSTVTTPDGIKTIESLDVGEKVLSYDESNGMLCFQAVKGKQFSGFQPVHLVSVGERKLAVTANHPFYSYGYAAETPAKLGRYKLAYVRADQLKKAIIPRTSIEYGAPYPLKIPNLVTQFNSMNQYQSDIVMNRKRESKMADIQFTTDDIMWLFGYWVGDGNIEIAQGKTEGVVRFAKVGFSTPRTDRARAKLMQTMTALIDVTPTERRNGYHLAWNSKELMEFFNGNGFEGKARDKRIPSWVWSLPESQRLAFIAGYMDADGTINKRRFSIKSSNQLLLQDLTSLLVTLGITPRLYTEFDKPKTVTIMGVQCIAHGAYRLVFGIDDRFFSFLSPAFQENAKGQPKRIMQLKRKIGRSNIVLSPNVEVVPIQVSKQSVQLAPTWDIEVEGTGNFISQGFIVHNSKITQKYPAIYLMGEGARGEVLSVALAGKGQHQDAGAKAVHLASNTTSIITSKSISKDGGRASYRGLLKVAKNAFNVKSTVRCDALLLDSKSRTDTYPYIEIDNPTATVGHEATVGRIGDDQLFYLMSRGLTEEQALTLIVLGFIQPFTKSLPMEYAVELNRLIEMEMENSVG